MSFDLKKVLPYLGPLAMIALPWALPAIGGMLAGGSGAAGAAGAAGAGASGAAGAAAATPLQTGITAGLEASKAAGAIAPLGNAPALAAPINPGIMTATKAANLMPNGPFLPGPINPGIMNPAGVTALPKAVAPPPHLLNPAVATRSFSKVVPVETLRPWTAAIKAGKQAPLSIPPQFAAPANPGVMINPAGAVLSPAEELASAGPSNIVPAKAKGLGDFLNMKNLSMGLIGAGLVSNLLPAGGGGGGKKKSKYDTSERTMVRQKFETPEGYRPGIDPEFNYFSTPSYNLYAEGGEVSLPSDQVDDSGIVSNYEAKTGLPPSSEEDKALVRRTIDEMINQGPGAENIFRAFIQRFGLPAFNDLDQRVQKMPRPEQRDARMIEGQGDGLSDSIVANAGTPNQAQLSDGEFVVPADVVSALGNGSTKAGSTELHGMMDRIRKMRFGNTSQPKAINKEAALAA